MKKIITRHWYKFLFITLLLSCSGINKPANEYSQENLAEGPSGAENQEAYYFRDSNDKTIGSINPGDPFVVNWGNAGLFRVGKGEKTKYRNEDQQNIYEIKYGEDGFKLRDSEGRLLWKVKYRGEKLKIADNEEMLNGFEIKSSGQMADVTRNSELIQSIDIRLQPSPILIKSAGGRLTVTGPTRDPAFCILAIDKIPGQEQLILITEILLAGRE